MRAPPADSSAMAVVAAALDSTCEGCMQLITYRDSFTNSSVYKLARESPVH